jgi:hypothetical protein
MELPMPQLNLDDVARRPQRYWDVDGLPELMMGCLWMIWGAAWLLGENLPRDGHYQMYWLFVPALLALSGFAAVWATKRLKARLTFPRTGYVEWKEPTRSAKLAAAAVAMLSAMALVLMISRDRARGEQATAPVLGVILSLAFVVASLRQRAPHYLALAGVAVALGLAFGATNGGWESANRMFVALGAASALLGAVRLARFLRQHPRATLETR